MTRAVAVRTCAGAALRGALAWAVPAGLAGMTWASHYSVWEWAVWRAEGLRLPLPPPFPVWLVGNLAWPWHILEYSPWWPELGFGPARWPARLWHDYAARAWQAPAAGAVPGALLGLRRGLARVRAESGPIHGAGSGQSGGQTENINDISIADGGRGDPPAPVGGAVRHLLEAVAGLGRDPALTTGWVTIHDLAAHPAIGEPAGDAGDDVAPVLAEALRRSGQWASRRREKGGRKITMWRFTARTDRETGHAAED